MIVATPASFNTLRFPRTSCRVSTSRLLSTVDSITRGRRAMDRAIATRCCWPPLRVWACGPRGRGSRPDRAVRPPGTDARDAGHHAMPNITLPRTVRFGKPGPEDHAHRTSLRREMHSWPVHGLPIDGDRPAAGAFESGDQPKQRRLPASRAPQHAVDLPSGHGESASVDHRGPFAVTEFEIDDLQHGRGFEEGKTGHDSSCSFPDPNPRSSCRARSTTGSMPTSTMSRRREASPSRSSEASRRRGRRAYRS